MNVKCNIVKVLCLSERERGNDVDACVCVKWERREERKNEKERKRTRKRKRMGKKKRMSKKERMRKRERDEWWWWPSFDVRAIVRCWLDGIHDHNNNQVKCPHIRTYLKTTTFPSKRFYLAKSWFCNLRLSRLQMKTYHVRY